MINNSSFFIGVVEDVYDPLERNRVRVRAKGYHSDSISVEDLPWSQVIMPNTTASTSGIGQTIGLVAGSWVFGAFLDEDYQTSLILGSIPSQGGPITSREYPTRANNNDTPKAATYSHYESQSFMNKNQTAADDIPTATAPHLSTLSDKEQEENGSWSLPKAKDYTKPSYPYNNVTQTEGGIIIEHDDTPKYKRIHEHHPSGTYREIINDGSSITRIKGSSYEIVSDEKNVWIVGNCNLTVDGEVKHFYRGNYTLEVEGDFNVNVHGDYNSKICGASLNEIIGKRETHINETEGITVRDNYKLEVKGGAIVVVKDVYDMSTTSGDYKLNVGGSKEEYVNNNNYSETYGSYSRFSSSVMKMTCGEKIQVNTNIMRLSGDVLAGGDGVSLITHLHTQKDGNDNGGGAFTAKPNGGTGVGK